MITTARARSLSTIPFATTTIATTGAHTSERRKQHPWRSRENKKLEARVVSGRVGSGRVGWHHPLWGNPEIQLFLDNCFFNIKKNKRIKIYNVILEFWNFYFTIWKKIAWKKKDWMIQNPIFQIIYTYMYKSQLLLHVIIWRILQNIWKIHVGKIFEYPTQGPKPLSWNWSWELFGHELCEGSKVKRVCNKLAWEIIMNIHEICFVWIEQRNQEVWRVLMKWLPNCNHE
jgi:hypothetical protein